MKRIEEMLYGVVLAGAAGAGTADATFVLASVEEFDVDFFDDAEELEDFDELEEDDVDFFVLSSALGFF